MQEFYALPVPFNSFQRLVVLGGLTGPIHEIRKFGIAHCPIHATKEDHDPQSAFDPFVYTFEFGPGLLALLLIYCLLQRFHEGFDRAQHWHRLSRAHGNGNLVGLELDILDISKSLTNQLKRCYVCRGLVL